MSDLKYTDIKLDLKQHYIQSNYIQSVNAHKSNAYKL